MDTIIHTRFEEGMLYESYFRDVDFEIAKRIHNSGQEWTQELLEKSFAFSRAKAIGNLLRIMQKGGQFHVKRTISYSVKVEY